MKNIIWRTFEYKHKNIWDCGEFRIEQSTSGNKKYYLSDGIGSSIGNGFDKLKDAKKVAQLIHNG